MKNISIIAVLVMALFCTGCGKINVAPTVIATSVDIWYKMDNNSLFGPVNPIYTLNDVQLYYFVDGKKIAYLKGNLDAPKGIKLISYDKYNANILRVFIDDPGQGNNTETIINIGAEISDTIRCEISKPNETSRVITKVWYNGQLKWDVASANNEFKDARFININK